MPHVLLIPRNVSGPLGGRDLPCPWLEVSLESRGNLAVVQPTSGQFEPRVKAQPSVNLDRNRVHRSTPAILNDHHAEALSQAIRAHTRYTEEDSVTSSPRKLNALDDWQAFHATELN